MVALTAAPQQCLDYDCKISHCLRCGAHMPFNGADSVIFTYCSGCEWDASHHGMTEVR